MARVHQRKARKDYPAAGISKGDMYYYAKIKTGPYSSREIRQKEPIKRSQLTSSSFLSQFYELEERFQAISSLSDAQGELEALAADARDLAAECQGNLENMPEGFQQGDTGQRLQERSDALEAWADELDEAASSCEDKLTELADAERAWDDYDNALAEYDPASDEDEPEEPDCDRPDDEADALQEILDNISEPDVS